jgi:phytol kinase
MNPILGMALVGGALGGMMLGLRLLKGKLHPELLRKLLHVGMGMVTLSFPWLFQAAWPVITLGVLASILMLLIRQSSALRNRLGGVVDGVKRESLGEVYFPVGVAVLFTLAKGDALAFCVPLLLLALGDAVAALIGVRYGSLHYTTDEGKKSLEGSLAFFLIAFLSVHIPFLLFSDMGRTECLFIGLIMGLLVMLIEALAWRGLDNLFVPLGGFVLLQTFRQLDAPQLGLRLGVTLLLVAFAVLWRRRTTLNDSAVLGAALIGFVAWAVGGWRWLLPPVTMFATYALLFPRQNVDGTSRVHDIHDVLRNTGVGMLWLFLASTLDKPGFLLPYAVSFAANLALIGVIRYRARVKDRYGKATILRAVAKSCLVILLPYILVEKWLAPALPVSVLFAALVLAPLGALIGVIGSLLIVRDGYWEDIRRRWYLPQVAVLAGSALVLVASL